MRILKAAVFLVALTAGGQAMANCQYLGNLYPVGYVICAEGWLQECTVAGYWSAIGMCHSPDAERPSTELRSSFSLESPAAGDMAPATQTTPPHDR